MTNETFIHNWIYNTESEGKHNNLSSRNNALYSYAEKIAEYKDGAFILSTQKWSITTSDHQSTVQMGCSGFTRYYIPSFHKQEDKDFKKVISDLSLKMTRARSEWRKEDYKQDIEKYIECRNFLYSRRKAWTFESIVGAVSIDYKKAKEKEEKEIKKLGGIDGLLKHFLKEGRKHPLHNKLCKFDFIRPLGDEYISTQGVRMEKKRADLIIKNIDSLKVNDKIDYYTVRELTKERLVLGCHNFRIKDLQQQAGC